MKISGVFITSWKYHWELKERELEWWRHTRTGVTSPMSPLRVSTWAQAKSLQTNGTSNSTAYVSVFSVNKDLTWLTTSASFMSVERMMPPPPLITTAIQEATVTAVSVMEGTRRNFDQTTSAQRRYTTLLHNAAPVASLMLNFKPTSCLSGLYGRRVQLIQPLLQGHKGTKWKWEMGTYAICVWFRCNAQPGNNNSAGAHGLSATMTAKDFHVFQSSFPPPSHAEQQHNLHCRLRSPSQLWS